MNFFSTSRKDDLIACFYILLFALNNETPVAKEKDLKLLAKQYENIEDQFEAFRNYKEKYSLSYLTNFLGKNMLLKVIDEAEFCPEME